MSFPTNVSARMVRRCLTARPSYRRSFAAQRWSPSRWSHCSDHCVVAVLYVAKGFFLPIVAAFVVGTMLSPAAGFLERHRIPRSVSAVLIVTAVGAGVTFIVGLISSPLMEWSTRLPELGSLLKDKLHVFDRPLALWQQLQGMLGGSDALRGAISDAEIRMGTADARIPVADLHRIPAVLCDADSVHRQLARSAPRADHDVHRSRLPGCGSCGSSTRSRNSLAATC